MGELSDFQSLGIYAEAGLKATTLALEQAARSGAAGRIPIAGAAVQREADGALTVVAVGCNGRIPAAEGIGYPTDHGETCAMRLIDNFTSWDWSRIVFATSLSPCIMCTRTLLHMNKLGLTRL